MSWLRLRRSLTPELGGVDAAPLEADYLEAAARALSLEPERLARVKASLLAEYRAAAVRAASSADRLEVGRGLFRMDAPRPVIAFALSVVLVVGSVGLVAAGTAPGRPFYGLRLGVESLTMPAADSSAHLAAEMARLERRLIEAEQATLEGDSGAAADAIAAYRTELGDAGPELVRAGEDAPRLGQVLADHAIVLARLGDDLSGPAKSSTAGALDQVNRLRQTMDQPPGHKPSDPGPDNGGGNGGGNGGSHGGGNGGGHGGGNGGGNGGGHGGGNGGGNGGGHGGGHRPNGPAH